MINSTCPNGLLTLTGRPRPIGTTANLKTDRQIWQMMNHDHATVGLHLGVDLDHSLLYSERSTKAWSQVQNDQWGTVAVSDAAGFPTVINHYGYHMTSWHIPLALSGQQARLYPAATASLTFDPKLTPDQATWSFPVFLPGRLGTIQRTADNTYVLSLSVGEVELQTVAVSCQLQSTCLSEGWTGLYLESMLKLKHLGCPYVLILFLFAQGEIIDRSGDCFSDS